MYVCIIRIYVYCQQLYCGLRTCISIYVVMHVYTIYACILYLVMHMCITVYVGRVCGVCVCVCMYVCVYM
jgi:hypothetical protein